MSSPTASINEHGVALTLARGSIGSGQVPPHPAPPSAISQRDVRQQPTTAGTGQQRPCLQRQPSTLTGNRPRRRAAFARQEPAVFFRAARPTRGRAGIAAPWRRPKPQGSRLRSPVLPREQGPGWGQRRRGRRPPQHRLLAGTTFGRAVGPEAPRSTSTEVGQLAGRTRRRRWPF